VFEKLKRMIRFYSDTAKIVEQIVGASVIVLVCAIMSYTVVPTILNGSDDLTVIVLPLLQTAIMLAGIFAAIGLIVYVARHGLGQGKK
jgi:hypothetical protein